MSIDDIKKLTSGFIKGWKKGKLKDKLQETAGIALEERIKNSELEREVQLLRDEIRRLKGEKEKPEFKPKIKPVSSKDLESKDKKAHIKSEKKNKIEIDDEVTCDLDKVDLPSDAKYIGERTVVVQDLIFSRKNLKFIIKRYFSAELGKIFEGEVPEHFKGSEFGPDLKSFVIYQYYKNRVPHKKILEQLDDMGISMSAGTLCTILNNPDTIFKDDLDSARTASIKRCSQVHIDDTGAKIEGENANTFCVSNKFYTQFTTSYTKGRWAAVGAILGNGEQYSIDQEAISFIANKLKKPIVTAFFSMNEFKEVYNKVEFEQLLKNDVFRHLTRKKIEDIKTACAMACFRKNGRNIRFLISDDGTNFISIFKNHQLCWIHEIRKYKLSEVLKSKDFEKLDQLVRVWRHFYHWMKLFKKTGDNKMRVRIRRYFDKITSLKLNIKLLDEQLERTKQNKARLLLFLKYPQLPLHNNQSENDIRERVIKRKISLQNRSMSGVRAWDLMLSLASTCRKNGISFWKYLRDRVRSFDEIPFLGQVIIKS